MILAIILFLVFLAYLFFSDKKEAIDKNKERGMKAIFPNFVSFVSQTYSDEMELVKDDGRYLEYRFPVYDNHKRVAGYYHIGIDSVFGANAYAWAISKNGSKHKGYFKEIYNGRSDKKRDLTIEEYSLTFDQLIKKIESSSEFEKLNFICLDSSKSSNKQKWFEAMSDADVSDYLKYIITSFFIPDNISFEKYLNNKKANDLVMAGFGLSTWHYMSQLSDEPLQELQCTPTFRNHYSEERMNRGLRIPEWFYVAYPDVAYWFHENLELLKSELEARENEFRGENGLKPQFFRLIIDRYKQSNGSLECAVQ